MVTQDSISSVRGGGEATTARAPLWPKWVYPTNGHNKQPLDGALGGMQFDLLAGIWIRNTSFR